MILIDQRLHALFDAEWERGLREDPVSATYLGDERYNHLLPDLGEAALRASQQADRDALAALQAIPLAELDADDRLNYLVFEWELRQSIDGQRFPTEVIALNQRGGIQTFDEMLEQMSFEDVDDYEDWIARMRAFGSYAEQTQVLMQRGAELHFAPPRVVMQRVSAQFARQVVERHGSLIASSRISTATVGQWQFALARPRRPWLWRIRIHWKSWPTIPWVYHQATQFGRPADKRCSSRWVRSTLTLTTSIGSMLQPEATKSILSMRRVQKIISSSSSMSLALSIYHRSSQIRTA